MSHIENVPSKKIEVDSTIDETQKVSNTHKEAKAQDSNDHDVISKKTGEYLPGDFKSNEPTLPNVNIPSSASWLDNTSGDVAAIFVEMGGWVRRQANEVAKFRYEEMDHFWQKTLELAETEKEKAKQQSYQAIANAVSSGVSGVTGIAQVAGTAWASSKGSAISNPNPEKDPEGAKLRYQEYAYKPDGRTPYTADEITASGGTPFTPAEKAAGVAAGMKDEINGAYREPVTAKSLRKPVNDPNDINYAKNTEFNSKRESVINEDARARNVEEGARSTVQGWSQIGSSFTEAGSKGFSASFIQSEGEQKAEETKQQTQQRMFQDLVSGWSERFSKLYEMHKELESAIREVQSSNRQALLSTYR